MPMRHGRRDSEPIDSAITGAANPARAKPTRFAALFWSMLLALAWASAQSTPVVALNTNRLAAGDTLTLEATLLRPEAPYVFKLGAPDGGVESTDAMSSANGTLRVSEVLEQPGRWSATLVGPGIEATFWIEVTPPPGTPAAAAPRNGATTPAAPLPDSDAATPNQPNVTQPETAAPDVVEPDATEPGATEPEATEPEATEPDTVTPSTAQPDTVTPDTAQPDTVTPDTALPGTPSAAPVVASLDGDTVVARRAGIEAWRLPFPPNSGETTAPLVDADTVYVGHGNSLLAIDAASGVVMRRVALPARATDLRLESAGVDVGVRYSDGATSRIVITAAGAAQTVTFDNDPTLFRLLQREAEVADPAARLAQDPTNPWLHVALAAASTPEQATDHYRAALAQLGTFYDAAWLARNLQSSGEPELAKTAMERALQDFADRGYRPELLTDRALRDAYGFPLSAMESALGRGDLVTAGFWAPYVYALSTPAVPETQAALRSYARLLRSAGERDQASLWNNRAAAGGGFRIGRVLDNVAIGLGRNGWYGVAALLAAIVALHLTLLAKYWRPQSLMLRQRHEAGHSTGPVPRLFTMRYYSLTEKVVLVLMFAAVLALAGMAGWAQRGDDLPPAWRSGTLASVPAMTALSDLPNVGSTPPAVTDPAAPTSPAASREAREAWFLRGFAAQMAGDDSAAARAYSEAGDLPGALNNLGVLRKNDALIQRALDIRPADPVARFNLGLSTDPSPFHAVYGGDEPLLAVPTTTEMRAALAGNVRAALAATFTNPWSALNRTNPLTTPAWLWTIFVVLFLLAAAVTVVWLLVPRPRLARNAPRTVAYHVLSLLLPGTGLSDELWGVLLLVPWAIFGMDALLHLLPGGVPPTMALVTDYTALGILYALNLVAYIVEFFSYRNRMRDLRNEHPDTARAYGMRVPSSAG